MTYSTRLLSLVCLVLASSLEGCSFLIVDNRRDVAFQTLFVDSENLDLAAYRAALTTRFPPGSSVNAVRKYVATVEGKCSARPDADLWCEIPLRVRWCQAEMLGITIWADAEVVRNLEVTKGGIGC